VSGIVTLLTDFGVRDAFVGIMKGVILGICPSCRIVDLTHDVEAQQVRAAALLLRSAGSYFPDGTIHVAVVDPGVGSARRAIVVDTTHGLLVGPDNGVLSLAAERLGIRQIHELRPGALSLATLSNTFHGRDLFAAAAAHLARGVPVAECGPRIDSLQQVEIAVAAVHESSITGEVIHVDHFGNLITNIGAELLTRFHGHSLLVTIGDTHIRGLVTSYAAVSEGCPLAVVASWDTLEIAVRNGNAAQTLAARPGSPVRVVGEAKAT